MPRPSLAFSIRPYIKSYMVLIFAYKTVDKRKSFIDNDKKSTFQKNGLEL